MKKKILLIIALFLAVLSLTGCYSIKNISYYPAKYTTVSAPNIYSSDFIHFDKIYPNIPIAKISSDGGTDYDTTIYYIHFSSDILIINKQFGRTKDLLILYQDENKEFTYTNSTDTTESQFVITFKNITSNNNSASFDLNIIPIDK